MDYDKDYEVFEKWFSENELRFAHGQFSDKQIAYSAWLAGREAVEQNVQRTAILPCNCPRCNPLSSEKYYVEE